MRLGKFILFWLILLTSLAFAQDVISFKVYEVQTFNNRLNKVTEKIKTTLVITVTKTKLIIASANDFIAYKFKGQTYNASKSLFYSSAIDDRGVACIIWFKRNSNTMAFGVEYTDYSFLYLVKKIN